MIEDGTNPFHQTRRHVIVLPLTAVPAPKKLRAKQVGRGFTAQEWALIKEIRSKQNVPSFNELVRDTRRESV